MKLLANENFPSPAVRRLREAGMDVLSVVESMPSAKDRDLVLLARKENRCIITFDRDYGDLIFREGLPPPPAILYFRQEPYFPAEPAEVVLALLSEPQEIEGCMIVISKRNIRRKRFPV